MCHSHRACPWGYLWSWLQNRPPWPIWEQSFCKVSIIFPLPVKTNTMPFILQIRVWNIRGEKQNMPDIQFQSIAYFNCPDTLYYPKLSSGHHVWLGGHIHHDLLLQDVEDNLGHPGHPLILVLYNIFFRLFIFQALWSLPLV